MGPATYHALSGDTDRIASVTALTDVRCVRVNARVFSEVLLQSRRFLRNLAKENTRVINELDERLMAASHKSNKAQLKALNNRLAKLVVSFDGDYKQLPFKLTHEVIADYCGCSRETVTRLLLSSSNYRHLINMKLVISIADRHKRDAFPESVSNRNKPDTKVVFCKVCDINPDQK